MEESQPPTTKRNCIPDSVNQTEMSNWRQTLVMVVALALVALVVAITVDQALGKNHHQHNVSALVRALTKKAVIGHLQRQQKYCRIMP